MPIIAITTTAGTGSETDNSGVITREDTFEKAFVGDASLFPVLSIVDPELMASVPPTFTAYQGFDALSQGDYRHHTAGHVRISGRIDPDRGEHAGAERAGPLPEYEGGSFLPLALPRMKSILPAMVSQGCMQPIDWKANLSRLYFDLAGNPTAEVLHALLTITTPDHILYGSDYPYLPDAVLQANLERLKQTLAADGELAGYADRILGRNAEQLFVRSAACGCTPTE